MYKVGDTVALKSGLKIGQFYGNNDFCYSMKFSGKREIEMVLGSRGYRLKGCGIYNYTNEMLNPAEPQSIIIYTQGNKTIAILKEGKKEVKRAEAKCNPEDTFDFGIGANLAIDRLLSRKIAWNESNYIRITPRGFFINSLNLSDIKEDLLKVIDKYGL